MNINPYPKRVKDNFQLLMNFVAITFACQEFPKVFTKTMLKYQKEILRRMEW